MGLAGIAKLTCLFAGIQLDVDEIGQLLCPGNPYRLRNRPCRGGRGLMGCMHFSDIIMTLTGALTFLCMHSHVARKAGEK